MGAPMTIFDLAQRGMSAQMVRMNAAASNLANAGSVSASEAGTYERAEIDGDLSGTSESKTPAIVWAIICAAVWLATWSTSKLLDRRIGKRRKQRWLLTGSPYLVGVPIFVVCLYVFFENFASLLPANF